MPNLKDIRVRIASVKNTRKITSAMKLVAAAKLKRAQDAVEAARPYATKMTQVIDTLASNVEADAHPLLQQPEFERNILVVLISSDRGLCGGFNGALFRTLERFIEDKREVCENIYMLTVGRKGNTHFKRNEHVDILKDYDGLTGNVDFDGAKRVAIQAMEMFKTEAVDTVYLVFNEFVSAINIIPTIESILPLSTLAAEGEEVDTQGVEYVYEPSEEELLDHLLPNSIETQVFQALLESEAAEQGSRMTAMDNATTNATDMIDALTLQYNRARQAYITKELVEIVSGAEALKG